MSNYFSRYAEPEVDALTTWPDNRKYQQVLCIPAYNENFDFIKRLIDLCQKKNDHILCILVINQPDTELDSFSQINLLHFLQGFNCPWQNKNLYLFNLIKQLDILAVERFFYGNRIPIKLGVGLARKIAADLASYLISHNKVDSDQLFMSDADAYLPVTYFESEIPTNKSAITFPYTYLEKDCSQTYAASVAYQLSINHYVEQLKKAGSPYAFSTLGSCIAVNYQYYIKVRGVPKRAAGEDFYLLNKLNKLAEVHPLKAPLIKLEARISNRVPFGTGPAVEAILNKRKPLSAFYFSNQAYKLLAIWIQFLEYIATTGTLENVDTFFLADRYLGVNESIDLIVNKHFAANSAIIKILNNHHTKSKRLRALHEWFDALKTLRFIKLFN